MKFYVDKINDPAWIRILIAKFMRHFLELVVVISVAVGVSFKDYILFYISYSALFLLLLLCVLAARIRCPRCYHAFFKIWGWEGFAPKCKHCGLEIGEDPSTPQSP